MSYRDELQSAEGFEAFYRRQSPRVLRFFASRIYESQLAFDLTAETFAQALRVRHRLRGETEQQAAAWLHSIARRQLSRYYRRGKAERRALDRLRVEMPRLDEEDLTEIETFADLGTRRDAVQAGLVQLSREHRRALQLRVVEERSYPEIARRLSVSEPTARARVSRALRALAQTIDAEMLKQEV